MLFSDTAKLAEAASELSRRNIFIGTSSWKYPGWCGQLYDEQRYLYRGKFSNARFEKNCLSEYAQVFKTVSVDAGYYRFPSQESVAKLVAEVPSDFVFCFKVTDEVTIKKFPNQRRHGDRAGKPNVNFLNSDLFQSAFLGSCEPFRDQIGLLMFEFSQFYKSDFESMDEIIERLDGFLGSLPKGWQYGVEIRNENLLCDGYFSTLARHGVTHVFNNWQRMPPIEEQLELEGSMTTDFFGSRFLLTPGRNYEAAVEGFSPYNETKIVDESARRAGARLLKKEPRKKSYLLVNNRLEGNSVNTIRAIMEMAGFSFD